MIRAKVIGASGYGGVGIVELLVRHPDVSIVALAAAENAGTRLSELYPHLEGYCDLPIVTPDEARVPSDVTFLATPDRVGMTLADAELAAGAKVIDYSGDFRFNSPEAYADYARRIGLDPTHLSPKLLPDAVYGLAELHRNALTASTTLVGNPGCFAVSCILGLAPAVRDALIEHEGMICDCKTGVSGAGKKPNPAFHFPARHEQMNAYRLSGHQHVCEIEQELGKLAGGASLKVTFTAQVVPLCRGIMSTLYGTLQTAVREEDVVQVYRDFYAEAPFVRVYGSSATVGSMQVRGSNHCNLVVSVDERTRRLRVVSYIDNLMKGQAGSALQNMNLLFGLPENKGIDAPPLYP